MLEGRENREMLFSVDTPKFASHRNHWRWESWGLSGMLLAQMHLGMENKPIVLGAGREARSLY